MTTWHISDIEASLEKEKWEIVRKEKIHEAGISEVWIIRSSKHQKDNIHLAFEGMDDLKTLPIEKSYACHAFDRKSSIYFSKSKKIWKRDLSEFIKKLAQH